MNTELDQLDEAIDAAFSKRMRLTSIRLLLWLIALLVAAYFWPEQRWIKWLLLLPPVSMLVVATMFMLMKRRLAKSKALEQDARR